MICARRVRAILNGTDVAESSFLTENEKRTHAMAHIVAALKDKTAAAAAADTTVRGTYLTYYSNVDTSCAAPSQLLLLLLLLYISHVLCRSELQTTYSYTYSSL